MTSGIQLRRVHPSHVASSGRRSSAAGGRRSSSSPFSRYRGSSGRYQSSAARAPVDNAGGSGRYQRSAAQAPVDNAEGPVDNAGGPVDINGRQPELRSITVKRHKLLRTWETPTFAHPVSWAGEAFRVGEGRGGGRFFEGAPVLTTAGCPGDAALPPRQRPRRAGSMPAGALRLQPGPVTRRGQGGRRLGEGPTQDALAWRRSGGSPAAPGGEESRPH